MEFGRRPQIASDIGQRVREGRLGFVVPGGGAHRKWITPKQVIRQEVTSEYNPSKIGVVRAIARSLKLALSFQAKVGAGLLEGNLDTPAHQVPM